MAQKILAISVIFLSSLLAGCTRFHVVVNGFAEPSQTIPAAATYAIFPFENQKNDIEFNEYARMVEVKLHERGLRKEDITSANVAILIVYGIDDGTQKAFAYSAPVYGSTNFSGTSYGSGGYSSFSGTSYGVKGYQTFAGTHTIYKRTLVIDVIDLVNLRNGGGATSLWKGKVTSVGSSGDIRLVMPYLIEAGFKHFGENTKAAVKHEFFEDEQGIVKLRETAQSPLQ